MPTVLVTSLYRKTRMKLQYRNSAINYDNPTKCFYIKHKILIINSLTKFNIYFTIPLQGYLNILIAKFHFQ